MTNDQENQIDELKAQGYGSRYIAEVVLGSKSKKSTVNDYLKRKKRLNDVEQENADIVITEQQILAELISQGDWDVGSLAKRLRTAQKTNSQLRRALNDLTDTENKVPDIDAIISNAVVNINSSKFNVPYITMPTVPKATMEILFSDWQVGKKAQYYNSVIAVEELKAYGEKLYNLAVKNTYNVERIVFASLGDIVEDHMKHGVQSATSTDSSLAEQMAISIECIWKYIVEPLASIGVPMEVVGIAGNHGSSEHKGFDMYKAGRYSYDYPIYKAIEGFCQVKGYDNVHFNLPEGSFGHTSIYNRHVVYEHGYNNNCTEKSMEDQRGKRSKQLKQHVEYFRVGDMHHVCNYDCGRLVVNGAFFGVDTEGHEYSGVLGFSSIPAQVVMFHVDNNSIGKTTVDSFISIQVTLD